MKSSNNDVTALTNLTRSLAEAPRAVTLFGAPEGHDAATVGSLLAAARGGIVDLYPAGAAQPIRLDFFGDTLESLRSFDPLTQRSSGALDGFTLRPVSEVLLDDTAIHRFRTRYREQFGAVGGDDTLYESVSAGRRHAGMEHWLPLYYETLETLFDYLPQAAVSFDYQADEARRHRLEAIADFYAARQSLSSAPRSTAPL